jgi:hypothetical protein
VPLAEVYLDECISVTLGHLLLGRGLTIHLPADVGTVHATDSDHLMTCMRAGWVLVTQNRRDFRRLHWLWTALYDWGLLPDLHPGIITIHEQVVVGDDEWATAITELLEQQASLRGQMYKWRPSSGRWEEEPARLM